MDKKRDYSEISSMRELEMAINDIRDRLSYHEQKISDDVDAIVSPINNAKYLISYGAMMFFSSSLMRSIMDGVKTGLKIFNMIKSRCNENNLNAEYKYTDNTQKNTDEIG